MNCPRCGERMTTICIDFGGGYICRPCTLKQFAPHPDPRRALILAAFDAGDESVRAALWAVATNHEQQRRAA